MDSWLYHLFELRRRLLRTAWVFLALFTCFFFYAGVLYSYFLSPLMHALPTGSSLLAIHVSSPVLAPLTLASNAAFILILPYLMIELWLFSLPGLYRHERSEIFGLILLSMVFFVLGLLFAYFIVLPYMFGFFASNVPKGVRWMPDMSDGLDFMTRMLAVFGLAFQMPLVCRLLLRTGLLDFETLLALRPYVIVAAFTLGMLLTPPDVLSQCILALPLWALYEVGLLWARLTIKKKEDRDAL